MTDTLRRNLGLPAAGELTRIWSVVPHHEVRTIVDQPHIAPRRVACPTYVGSPGETVILVGPDNKPVRRSEVDQRVHDEETLLGAIVSAFGKQAPDAARKAQIAEDVIQDSAVIALSKLRRAEAEHEVKALIPEGLVYYVVRGALRHRSFGDGRTTSTESGQAREKLMRLAEEAARRGEDTDRQGFLSDLAEEIRDSYPARRRPTSGYMFSWLEVPASEDIRDDRATEIELHSGPSAEETVLGRSDIPAIADWQDEVDGSSVTESPNAAYPRAILHAGAPRLAPRKQGRAGSPRKSAAEVLEGALNRGAQAVRDLVEHLGHDSAIDPMFDLSEHGAAERLRELVALCDDDAVIDLLSGAVKLSKRGSRHMRAVA